MEKDFNRWNKHKIHIDSIKARYFFEEREVWWVNLGENIGSEENGKGSSFRRPVLVFKKFNKDLFWALPLSTKLKPENPFYKQIVLENGLKESVILSQLRALDAKRLIKKIGTLPKESFEMMQKSVVDLCRPMTDFPDSVLLDEPRPKPL